MANLDDPWLAGDAARRRIVRLGQAAYPPDLRHCPDPPPVLWMAGQVPAAWPRALAIVGSRNPTPQGLDNARAFARSLAEAGWTIVSGLATGIDGAAHEGALEGAAPGQLATIAVMGTGLDQVYPRRHQALADRILDRGLLLSECPPGTPPRAWNFPRRNRIIAALSQGTLVVEAALKSGSLITASCALEQGREVFAIPGSIHSPLSRGCHALIKQGAKLVETAQDVLEEIAPGMRPCPSASLPGFEASGPAPAAPEDPLLQALGYEPATLDTLQARTGLPTPQLQAQLMALELQGEVARLPGGWLQRLVRA